MSDRNRPGVRWETAGIYFRNQAA